MHLQKQFEAENLNAVGTPDITDVHFHDCAPLQVQGHIRSLPGNRARRVQQTSKCPTRTPRSPTRTSPSASTRSASRRRSTSISTRARSRTAIIAVVSLESLAGVDGDPVKSDEMVLEIGGQGHLRRLHRESARAHARRREGFRSRLPGGLRLREAGRQDGQIPRRAQGPAPQGTARTRRRVRPGTGRLPHRGRTQGSRPQGASSPSASTKRSRKPRTRSWTSWWTRTISRCPKPSSNARSRTAWSSACAPWPSRASIPAKLQAGLGKGEGIAAG